jgi:chromate transporter
MADLLYLFGHFLVLSLLSVGGAIATVPDMHRLLVHEHGWLTDIQFNESIALAQAAPGPNLLFVALLGWNTAGWAGVAALMSGIMLPSSLLAVGAARLGRRHQDHLAVRAFSAGMAPVTVALLLATAWLIGEAWHDQPAAWTLAAGTAAVLWRWRPNPLWLIAVGAAAGALGVV